LIFQFNNLSMDATMLMVTLQSIILQIRDVNDHNTTMLMLMLTLQSINKA
jgi:hypothetical protein